MKRDGRKLRQPMKDFFGKKRGGGGRKNMSFKMACRMDTNALCTYSITLLISQMRKKKIHSKKNPQSGEKKAIFFPPAGSYYVRCWGDVFEVGN